MKMIDSLKVFSVRILIIISLLFTFFSVSAQEYGGTRCDSIKLLALNLIPQYYEDEKTEELWDLVTEWEAICGSGEYLDFTYTLLELASGVLKTEKPPQNILHDLARYREIYKSDYRYESQRVYQRYMSFLERSAQVMDTLGMSADEKYIRSFLANRTNFKSLARLYLDAQISKDYEKWVDSYEPEFGINLGVYQGWFVPLGNNRLFGQHYVFGGGLYVVHKWNQFGFEVDTKIGKSKEKYMVFHYEQEMETKNFGMTSFCFFYGKRVFRKKWQDVWLRVGFGGDHFVPISNSDTDGDGEIDYWGLNLGGASMNFGLKYRWHFCVGGALEAGVFYHVSTLYNSGGTNIKGNYLTFRLKIALDYVGGLDKYF